LRESFSSSTFRFFRKSPPSGFDHAGSLGQDGSPICDPAPVTVTLDAETRELLRQRVDRARREKIGQRHSHREAWITLPEAAVLTGIKAAYLRQQVIVLGIPTRRSGRRLIPVDALELLRAWG
jgi:hypothetical protein